VLIPIAYPPDDGKLILLLQHPRQQPIEEDLRQRHLRNQDVVPELGCWSRVAAVTLQKGMRLA
jgi:hypothetical protein